MFRSTKKVIGFGLMIVVFASGCDFFKSKSKTEVQSNQKAEAPVVPSYKDITIPDVIVTDLTTGTGAVVSEKDTVFVFYNMWIYDPAKPENRGARLAEILPPQGAQEIDLTKKEVVAGFSKGLIGMKVGGKRRLIIPKELGYGSQGSGAIPPDAILLVEVSLQKID